MSARAARAPEVSQDSETDQALRAAVPALDERIRRRAHEIWLERGSPDGSDTEDWLAAEKEIRNGSDS